MNNVYMNPLNISYAYQFHRNDCGRTLNREAADPSMVQFKGRYYIFLSMSEGFFASDDLINWRKYPLRGVPTYDYAPDACVIGDWLYVCASKFNEKCDFYRVKQPETDEFERIEGTFPFWDPHLFLDDDGRMYFYWGCSNDAPIWGTELNPETMRPIGSATALIANKNGENGYERVGEDHSLDINPFIEGAWINKHEGKYYLQYAAPGTEYNTYCDGVYMSDSPLGPYTLADNNPYSYSPGGYFPGAGHGSTMFDIHGNLWHTATMRISKTHLFERRIGIWPAGFDEDGELYCNQRYGDWPIHLTGGKLDAWAEPEWMLLSYGKKTSCSSAAQLARNAVDENVQTWWQAETPNKGEWLAVDLGSVCTINAVQVNFADDFGALKHVPKYVRFNEFGRYIDVFAHYSRWLLEGSCDGDSWLIIEDKRNASTDLPHDFIVRESGLRARFVKLTILELPYGAKACVSGLRVFGKADGNPPSAASNASAVRMDGMSMLVSWTGDALGYEVLWGHKPDKLYHSYRVFGKNSQEIRALVSSCERYYVRVDAFNECGITHGELIEVT